ncbi:hypothetical protein Pmar_PMAR003743 [Perkinsus marinus ATCC 50983]|uniref:Uncharacterized protein n=1 Tax=Perkinsus marinus (strain ATCC 50983 / TXsc) TaxID=423536 RepID=C5KI67_PERM5|nr:hypothetical protein Pmar_PMAR003743 [Perkinsus marinus ATCC 50983]EER16279.1 hypothetical protein Pmar_PMAR003743 [Perkinsus marinus ATCC 50983]|eukprot:XP_002784483.1 hypothetical protein Pmar_PMAR003743 [Perkinsus marinus ATCC 50983]
MLVCNERQSSTCSSVASVYLPYKEEAAMVIQRFMRDRWRSRPVRPPWWSQYGLNCLEAIPLSRRQHATVIIQRRFRQYLIKLVTKRRMRYLRHYEVFGRLMEYEHPKKPANFEQQWESL